ncbi:hypothetical protein [Vibrio quintilis]|uniref:Uncharacterized protein n=1 Tax=Vibrio quintilis TaxID=1117707 RepID=A0A1M7YP59_9VIBR|nr:hypothetical protein [Vibrio quintilis]SHO54408.1 hypothetical protein VQ7734_00122 [Vibrio quintilis]
MQMVPVSDFLPTLRSMVSNAITMDMKTAVVQSAVKFCRESKVLTHERSIETVYAGMTVKVVDSSGVNRRTPGAIKSSEIVSVKAGDDDLDSGTDYAMTGLDSIKFNDDFNDVEFIAVVEPQSGTQHLPQILLTDWCDVICHGAASILDSKSSGPELQMTSFHEREFTEGIRRAYRWRIDSLPELNPTPARRKAQRTFF